MIRLNRNTDAGGNGGSIEDFMNGIKTPAYGAIDSNPRAAEVPAADLDQQQSEAIATAEPEAAKKVFDFPSSQAEPVFTPADTAESNSTAAKGPLMEDAGMNFIDMMQAQMCHIATGTPVEDWRFNEDEKMLLDQYVVPVLKKNGTDWLKPEYIAAGAAIMIVGTRAIRATKIVKENKRNKEAIKKGTGIATAVAQAGTEDSGTRTRFTIHSDGTYQYSRNGKSYLAKGTGEKVDLSNADEVKEVIKANGGFGKLQRAFNLPDNYLQQHNINIEEEQD